MFDGYNQYIQFIGCFFHPFTPVAVIPTKQFARCHVKYSSIAPHTPLSPASGGTVTCRGRWMDFKSGLLFEAPHFRAIERVVKQPILSSVLAPSSVHEVLKYG